MKEAKTTLQVCVNCRPDPEDGADRQSAHGAQLFASLKEALKGHDGLADKVQLQPVECMNMCKSSCSAVLQCPGKFSFVIGNLSAEAERIDDLVAFAEVYCAAENGLPAWRARPPFIRKNTLARIHPISQTDLASAPNSEE